jgi:lipopolysaccharide transport protein LptA
MMKKIFPLAALGAALFVMPLSAQDSPTLSPGGNRGGGNTGGLGGFGQDRPANAETEITAREQATFDNRTGIAEFIGSVVVKDPQFTLTADRLKAFLNAERKGLERVEAEGNVVIRQENKDDRGGTVVSTARAGRAIFNPATGDVDLIEWPQVTQGINAHVATEAGTVMVLNRAGKINTQGASRTMIVDTGGAP